MMPSSVESEKLAASSDRRRWPVRLIMLGIVFTLVLPGLVFGGLLILRLTSAERARVQQAMEAAALRGAETLDREVGSLSAALVALSTSSALEERDLAAFQRRAEQVAKALGQHIVLSAPDGQQLVNTRVPYGSSLPRMGSLETVRTVVERRALAVSNLFSGAASRQNSVAVISPVLREGVVISVLAISIPPQYITDLLQRQGLPAGWAASVVDGNHRVVARSSEAERFVGEDAAPTVVERAGLQSAFWVGATRQGVPVLAAQHRLRLADWRVIITQPREVMEAPLRGTLRLLGMAGLSALAVACVLAWLLARLIARPLRGLAEAGRAMGDGRPVGRVRSVIAEVDAVSGALVQATRDLRSRTEVLTRERAQLAAIVDTVPVGLVICDAGGRIVSGNACLERILRHPVLHSANAAAYGEWVAHHADGTVVRAEEFPLARVLAGAAHAEMQCIYRRGDGSPCWVHFIAAPICGPDGAIEGGVVATLDIDEVVRSREAGARFAAQAAQELEGLVAARTAELERANQRLRTQATLQAAAEEQLRQSQKMEAVGQLTGGIAHDFNNLLTIVMGSLELLRRRIADERAVRLVDNALQASGRAATLTARLLAFSRRQPLMPQPVELDRLVAGMVDLLRRTLGEAIRVETSTAGQLWQAHADPNQVENALLNLAVNARDAMLGEGVNFAVMPLLVIETGNAVLGAAELVHDPDVPPGEYVRVSVSDNGAGMDRATLARAFEPFFTTKPVGQGTGLGLSQVHGFVKQSGGHVTIATAPGRGTTVSLYLPRYRGEGLEAVVAGPLVEVATSPLVVLVVEDDAGVRRFTVEALRELGHSAIEADAAPQAMRMVETHPEIGVLLTDVILPGADGVQLAERVRALRPGLPVLFTTGFTGAAGGSLRGRRALPGGAVVLDKPFTIRDLAVRLRGVLET